MAWFINDNFVYCSHLEKVTKNMIGHTLYFKCLYLNGNLAYYQYTTAKIIYIYSVTSYNAFNLTQYGFRKSKAALKIMQIIYASSGFTLLQK